MNVCDFYGHGTADNPIPNVAYSRKTLLLCKKKTKGFMSKTLLFQGRFICDCLLRIQCMHVLYSSITYSLQFECRRSRFDLFTIFASFHALFHLSAWIWLDVSLMAFESLIILTNHMAWWKIKKEKQCIF